MTSRSTKRNGCFHVEERSECTSSHILSHSTSLNKLVSSRSSARAISPMLLNYICGEPTLQERLHMVHRQANTNIHEDKLRFLAANVSKWYSIKKNKKKVASKAC